MTDEEMAKFLGLGPEDGDHMKFVRGLPPGKRELFERMASLEEEVRVWREEGGPRPPGVLID